MAKQAEGCAVLRLLTFEGFKAWPKLPWQFRSPIETVCSLWGGTMAKQAEGLCGAEAFESCCGAFEAFKAWPKRAM